MMSKTAIPQRLLACTSSVLAQSSVQDRFRLLDKNADGKLSAEEFPYPVVFKQLDKDGDGSLSPKETEAIPTRGKTPLPSPANPLQPTTKPDSKPVAPIPLSEVPRNDAAETPLARLVFAKDYFPSRKELHGQFMGRHRGDVAGRARWKTVRGHRQCGGSAG
jgi:hypothetical protein